LKGFMNALTRLKLRFPAIVGVATLFLGGAVTVAISQTSRGDKMTAEAIAEKSREAYAALSSYSDSGRVVSEMGGQTTTLTFHTRLQRPNLYRIDWAQGTKPKGVVWSDGSGDYLLSATTGEEKNAQPQKMQTMKKALTQATGPSWSAASMIPGAFFNQDCGDVFVAPVASGRYPLQKENDDVAGGVDCYVVSSVLDFSKIPDNKGKPGTATTTLWIGKADSLIHQSRTKYLEKVDSSEQAIDDAIKKSLKKQNKPATPEAIAAMRPQMRTIMKQIKSGLESGVVTTHIYENISVNQKFLPADFAR
jgi:outer membrane lipoprotein-sorting protein